MFLKLYRLNPERAILVDFSPCEEDPHDETCIDSYEFPLKSDTRFGS
jgi:hypothetical protein